MMTRHYPGVTEDHARWLAEQAWRMSYLLVHRRRYADHDLVEDMCDSHDMLAEYFGLDLDDLRKEMDRRHALGRNDYENESRCEDEEEEDC